MVQIAASSAAKDWQSEFLGYKPPLISEVGAEVALTQQLHETVSVKSGEFAQYLTDSSSVELEFVENKLELQGQIIRSGMSGRIFLLCEWLLSRLVCLNTAVW